MKIQNLTCLFAFLIGMGVAGCASSRDKIYDPSIRSDAPTDRIRVVSLDVKPVQPIAPDPWQVTMRIQNVSDRPLENVSYKFMLGGKGDQLGSGKIPQLNPGETRDVTSNVARVQQGTHRVEGRVFLQRADEEPDFRARMNNWMATNVVVAQ